MHLNLRRTLHTTTVALLVGAALTACSGTGDSADDASAPQGGATTSEHNDADTAFAQMMIVHHEGAVEMAELAVATSDSPEVKDLATRIADAQQPEIDLMTGWLTAWGEEVEVVDHAGMDMAGMDMNGMSQEEVMGHLETLEGAEFDTQFLDHMIAHHEGAIEMAEAEIQDGVNEDATRLAQTIIDAQTTEIVEMEGLAEAPAQ
ncbi:DUF305 domain-containing protein [Myceligenerans cantabricum]